MYNIWYKTVSLLSLLAFSGTVILPDFGDAVELEKPRVAVMDLIAKQGISAIESSTLSGILRTAVFKTGRFEIINREDMATIAENHRIELAVCDEDACLLKMGSLLGAQKLIVGDIGKVMGKVVVNIRLVNVAGTTLSNEAVESGNCSDNLDTFTETINKMVTHLIPTKIADLKKVGNLYVKSIPSGMKVYLNDTDVKQVTPVALENIAVGEYIVKIENNTLVGERQVEVKLGEYTNVEVPAFLKAGTLNIVTNPDGAEVLLDGRDTTKKTPVILHDLTLGTHNVKIRKPGYYTEKETVVTNSSKQIKLEKHLRDATETIHEIHRLEQQKKPLFTEKDLGRKSLTELIRTERVKKEKVSNRLVWLEFGSLAFGAVAYQTRGSNDTGKDNLSDLTFVIPWLLSTVCFITIVIFDNYQPEKSNVIKKYTTETERMLKERNDPILRDNAPYDTQIKELKKLIE